MAMDDRTIYRPSNLLYNQERMTRYRPGGFHPVCLGDTFKEGRYTIHHKLGWGGFSTVWLARDTKLEMWVSIKVKTAESLENSRELDTLRALGGIASARYIVKLLDDFIHHGPNGHHQCLVFELLGPSVNSIVSEYLEDGAQLDPDTSLKISTQLLQGIASIHTAGYAHGDINGSNVAFAGSKLAHLSSGELFEILGAPESEDLVRLDGEPLDLGLPRHLVEKAGWGGWDYEDDEDIRLIDFGEAFVRGSEPDALAQPGDLNAPETILTDHFDYRVDVWRAGIMIYSVLFGSRPFQTFGDPVDLVSQMIGFVEALPTEWQSQWDRMRVISGQGTSGQEPNENPVEAGNEQALSELEQEFQERIQDPSLQPLLPVISGLMRFRPSDRISIEEALDIITRAEHSDVEENHDDAVVPSGES